MSRCDFENSQISAQDTVGVAGDDIMFHILVYFVCVGRLLQGGHVWPESLQEFMVSFFAFIS